MSDSTEARAADGRPPDLRANGAAALLRRLCTADDVGSVVSAAAGDAPASASTEARAPDGRPRDLLPEAAALLRRLRTADDVSSVASAAASDAPVSDSTDTWPMHGADDVGSGVSAAGASSGRSCATISAFFMLALTPCCFASACSSLRPSAQIAASSILPPRRLGNTPRSNLGLHASSIPFIPLPHSP